MDRDGPHRCEERNAGLGADAPAGVSSATCTAAISPCSAAAASLVKIIWHDGIGMSLYAKRLGRGRFIWSAANDGVLSLTAAQPAWLLEGIKTGATRSIVGARRARITLRGLHFRLALSS